MRPMTGEEKRNGEILKKRELILIRISLMAVIAAIAAGIFFPDPKSLHGIERKMKPMREERQDDGQVVRMLYLNDDGHAEVREDGRVVERYDRIENGKYRQGKQEGQEQIRAH